MSTPPAAPFGPATLVTPTDLRQYLDEIPQGQAIDALLQVCCDRAEALVRRQLVGVELTPPADPDIVQIILELASSTYLTRGTSSLLETVGAEDAGGFQYVGQLNDRQKNSLRQYRIAHRGVAV